MTIEYTDGSSAQLPASIVATDAQHDLAVLRIDATPDLVQPIKASNALLLHDTAVLHADAMPDLMQPIDGSTAVSSSMIWRFRGGRMDVPYLCLHALMAWCANGFGVGQGICSSVIIACP